MTSCSLCRGSWAIMKALHRGRSLQITSLKITEFCAVNDVSSRALVLGGYFDEFGLLPM